jgi:hypothetical protein
LHGYLPVVGHIKNGDRSQLTHFGKTQQAMLKAHSAVVVVVIVVFVLFLLSVK